MTKQIPLTQGKVAIVDDADYEWLSQWKWRAQRKPRSFYAVRHGAQRNKKRRMLCMHRVILNAPRGMWTDHINSDGLDNRRANLRLCTPTQNNRHRRKHRATASRFKGVSFHQGKWRARIKVNGKQLWLGGFTHEKDAAHAYNAAAIRLHGEFAALNDLE